MSDEATRLIGYKVGKSLQGNVYSDAISTIICWDDFHWLVTLFSRSTSQYIKVKMGAVENFTDMPDKLRVKFYNISHLSQNVFYKDTTRTCNDLDVWMSEIVDKTNPDVAVDEIVEAAHLFRKICKTQIELVQEEIQKGK